MAHTAIRDTQRLASRYAEDLGDEVESWKPRHDAAMSCRDFEEQLAVFNGLTRLFLEAIDRYESFDAHGAMIFVPEAERYAERAILSMAESCSRVDGYVRSFEGNGFTVDGAEDLRSLQTRVLAHRDEVTRIAKAEGRMGFRGVTMSPEDANALRSALSSQEAGACS